MSGKSFTEFVNGLKVSNEVNPSNLMWELNFDKYGKDGDFSGRKCNESENKEECEKLLTDCVVNGKCCDALMSANLFSSAKDMDGQAAVKVLEKLGFKKQKRGSPYGQIYEMESVESWMKRGNKVDCGMAGGADSNEQKADAMMGQLNELKEQLTNALNLSSDKDDDNSNANSAPQPPTAVDAVLKNMVKEVNNNPVLLNPGLNVDKEGFAKKPESKLPKLGVYTLSGGYLGELAAMENTFNLESKFIKGVEQTGGADFAPALKKDATERAAALESAFNKILKDLERQERELDKGEEAAIRGYIDSLKKTEQKAFVAVEYLRRFAEMVRNGQVTDADKGTYAQIVDKKGRLEKKIGQKTLKLFGILADLGSVAIVPAVVAN